MVKQIVHIYEFKECLNNFNEKQMKNVNETEPITIKLKNLDVSFHSEYNTQNQINKTIELKNKTISKLLLKI